MSFPYQKVTQTNRLARTPASSAAAQPSGSANQEIQYTPGLRQVVDVLPVSVAHRDGVDPAVTKAAKDRYEIAPSLQNPAKYTATVPGDVAGKKQKLYKLSKKSGSKSRSRSGSKSKSNGCHIL
ncbi:hypothetical protein sscle_02g021500 [Sclerotinia sclerotiorum 1980 UF-70]|uniref:Uncharacterized protein n=1 Tax=Sclerotinia sclerotiorum (strain ATCC 18683 / 1980 / Ss-1) TaxID=665079 RepID=A0A1D9PXH0_SCLS1|nr:hypothetical protein sscle_02g021500 [Sclerotinia sclerotiorum 1980 UF-70]